MASTKLFKKGKINNNNGNNELRIYYFIFIEYMKDWARIVDIIVRVLLTHY